MTMNTNKQEEVRSLYKKYKRALSELQKNQDRSLPVYVVSISPKNNDFFS